MLRRILFYGVIAGLVVGAALFTTMMVSKGQPLTYGMALGYLTMLVALSAVFVGIKRHRDLDRGGVIRFWPAFGTGVGISLVASVLYVLSWELSLAVTGLDFAQTYADAMLERQREQGASAAELAAMAAKMERFAVQYANPVFRMPMTLVEIFPVGVLVSAISAGLLRNPKFMPARG